MATKPTQTYTTGSGVKTTTTKAPVAAKKPTTSSTAVQKAAADLAKSQAQLTQLLGQLATSVAGGGSGVTASGRTDASYMAEGRSGTSTTGQNYIEGRAVSPAEFNAWLYGTNSGGAAKPAASEEYVTDAATLAKDKILADTLTSYGLTGVAATVATIRAAYPKASSEDILFILKNDPAYNTEYNTRFAGNATLKKAGKPTLSDAQYLQAEVEYGKIFTAYGATTLANQTYYATLIGNSMDAVDVTNRMNQAYAKYKANPQIKQAFNTFYNTVTDGDVLAVILDPGTQLPLLEQKVTAAEIGGAALAQGLETSLARAEELRGYGATGATAQTGYQTIAKKLPRATFLSEISPETGIDYTQATAEDIQFKKNAEAQRQEDVLVGTEIGRFGGSAGRLASKSRAQGLV